MDPGVCALEVLGVLFSTAAWLCSLATTLMSTWLTLSTDLLPTESYELGLWATCVVQELGSLECRPHDSLLGLPPDILLARILMCFTVATGVVSLVLTIPGMHMVNICDRRLENAKCKRLMRMAAAAICFLAGVLCLIPVSYVAHLTVVRYYDDDLPEMVPRWEFGDALFCGWVAGVLHLVAGALLLASCICRQGNMEPSTDVPVAAERMTSRWSSRKTRSEYV